MVVCTQSGAHLSGWLGQSQPVGYTEDWSPSQTFSPCHLFDKQPENSQKNYYILNSNINTNQYHLVLLQVYCEQRPLLVAGDYFTVIKVYKDFGFDLNWEDSLLTLSVEFLTHSLTPLSAQLPNPTWVTDVCTLQSNLKARRTVNTYWRCTLALFYKCKSSDEERLFWKCIGGSMLT